MNWRETTRRVPVLTVAEAALAVAATAAGVLVYQDFFTTTDYLLPLVLACFVGGVTAALTPRRAWATALAAVTGLVFVVVVGVFDSAGSVVLAGMRGSWNRLLTTAVPTDPWGELLVVPTLVMWAAAFGAVFLARRTRHALAPVAPPLAGLVFAMFIVGSQTRGHMTATAAYLVVALALIAIRAYRSADGGSGRAARRSSRPVVALALVALMIAASALFGVAGSRFSSLASGENRFDFRNVLSPPFTSSETLTPLAQLKKQLNENPPRPLFTVRFEGDSIGKVDRVRTAALDTFNGTTWTSADLFRTVGTNLHDGLNLSLMNTVTAHVELEELSGRSLPVVGRPVWLNAPGEPQARFGYDPRSGSVVGTKPPERGFSYDVTGLPARRDLLAESRIGPDQGPVDPLPAGVPEVLRTLAEQLKGEADQYGRLVALESRLQSVRYRLDRPPGHSYAALARLLADGDEGGGFAEQNAAAFTTIARMWGFQARVAVGYRLETVENNTFRVTTANAYAWSEVKFAGEDWIAFDPTTTGDTPHTPPSEAPRVVPPPPSQPGTEPTTGQPDSSQNASKPTDTAGEQGLGWHEVMNGTLVLVLAAVALVVLAGGVVFLAKDHRRRFRRDGPDPATRVLGAWREQLDRLAERGISPPVSLTCHEVAAHVRGRIGDAAEPVEVAAGLVTTAIWAPEQLVQAEADQAWELVARLKAALYPRRVSAARLRAAVDPRPLWTEWGVARRRRQAGEELEMGRYR